MLLTEPDTLSHNAVASATINTTTSSANTYRIITVTIVINCYTTRPSSKPNDPIVPDSSTANTDARPRY